MKHAMIGAISALLLTAGMSAASTVLVDFDSGSLSGGVFVEDGFTFTSSSSGGASLANNCPVGGTNTSCLQLNNNETITVTFSGGTFDVLGFLFNAPGNGGDLNIGGSNGTALVITEAFNGNTLTQADFTTEFTGLTSFTFQNSNQGSGRIDNVSFGISVVPVPAAGLLMMTAIGGVLGLRRRRRTS